MALGLTSQQEAIREGVAELCKQFPGEYWRELDRESAYPQAFVAALRKREYRRVPSRHAVTSYI